MADHIALVTGAASGIGNAVTRQLAARGARVAVCDVNESAGQALAAAIGGGFFHCDVSSWESVCRAVDACVAEYGVPSYAHLNAGIMTVPTGQPFLALQDVSIDQYRRILGVNLDGVFHGLKRLLPQMQAELGPAGGAITLTASTAAFGVLPIDPLYALSKHGVVGLGRAVAAANEGSNVRINVICPGVVDTAIVPDQFKAPEFGMMPPEELAAEVIDLLYNGANGEVRVKLGGRPGFAVPAQDVTAM